MSLFVKKQYLLLSYTFDGGKTITISPTESSAGQSYNPEEFDRRVFGYFCAEKLRTAGCAWGKTPLFQPCGSRHPV